MAHNLIYSPLAAGKRVLFALQAFSSWLTREIHQFDKTTQYTQGRHFLSRPASVAVCSCAQGPEGLQAGFRFRAVQRVTVRGAGTGCKGRAGTGIPVC